MHALEAQPPNCARMAGLVQSRASGVTSALARSALVAGTKDLVRHMHVAFIARVRGWKVPALLVHAYTYSIVRKRTTQQ